LQGRQSSIAIWMFLAFFNTNKQTRRCWQVEGRGCCGVHHEKNSRSESESVRKWSWNGVEWSGVETKKIILVMTRIKLVSFCCKKQSSRQDSRQGRWLLSSIQLHHRRSRFNRCSTLDQRSVV
jgi:hypothetical protein